jgi:lysyl-tRNA synthetase class 2
MEPAGRDEFLVWELRSALKKAVRAFFERRGYVEVETPLLVACPGVEVHLGYFSSAWVDAAGRRHTLFLRSSPELHMKRVLALGLRRIFQIATCFRNGGELTPWHHPEFTMLEWYEAGIGFEEFIDQTEELLRFTREELASRLPGSVTLRLPPRFRRLSVEEAFRELGGLSLVDGDPGLARKARELGIPTVLEDDDFETAYFKILVERVEPGLAGMGGAVLYDYPASQAVLAKVEGGWAKRFEFYLGGVEICNGFLELTDPAENRRRIEEAYARRVMLGNGGAGAQGKSGTGGEVACSSVPPPDPVPDEEFFRALEAGIPPCAGNALGFDRWLALLVGLEGIARVIPFRESGIYRG